MCRTLRRGSSIAKQSEREHEQRQRLKVNEWMTGYGVRHFGRKKSYPRKRRGMKMELFARIRCAYLPVCGPLRKPHLSKDVVPLRYVSP